MVGGGVTTGRLWMEPAEQAYCSVRRLSSAKATSGVQHAIIIVTAVPPRQSERSLVSVESRYGTWLGLGLGLELGLGLGLG